jgi:parallel beta-helix repeat protein
MLQPRDTHENTCARPLGGGPSVKVARSVVTLSAALGAAVLPAAVVSAATTTWYVDNGAANCSDTGPGTATQPFCTIKAGAAKATAGQTVQVAAGTYSEAVTVPRSGTSSAPITFQAAPGATVTVTGGTNGFKISSKTYVVIRGFTVTGTSGVGIVVSGSSHITLDGNDVSVAGQRVSGLIAKGISLSGTTASLVQNNKSHDNSDAGIGVTSTSTGNVITGNESYNNARGFSRAAAGIDLRNSPNNTISANRLHDNEDSGLNIWSASTGTVAVNNVIWHNGDHGIDVHSNNDAVVVANTVYKNYDSGIEMTGSLRTYLANNISADNGINSARTSGQLRADATSAPSTVADYDLLYLSVPTSSKTVYLDWGGTKYTTLTAFTAATGEETHGIQANPAFVNAAAYDLHLTSGSPAVDSGNNTATDEPATDADGVARPVGGTVDRGAYEFH